MLSIHNTKRADGTWLAHRSPVVADGIVHGSAHHGIRVAAEQLMYQGDRSARVDSGSGQGLLSKAARQLKEWCCSLLDSLDPIWSKHHNNQVDTAAMRQRQLYRHDSRNISCRDMVDLRLLDETSTAPPVRSPAAGGSLFLFLLPRDGSPDIVPGQ